MKSEAARALGFCWWFAPLTAKEAATSQVPAPHLLPALVSPLLSASRAGRGPAPSVQAPGEGELLPDYAQRGSGNTQNFPMSQSHCSITSGSLPYLSASTFSSSAPRCGDGSEKQGETQK